MGGRGVSPVAGGGSGRSRSGIRSRAENTPLSWSRGAANSSGGLALAREVRNLARHGNPYPKKPVGEFQRSRPADSRRWAREKMTILWKSSARRHRLHLTPPSRNSAREKQGVSPCPSIFNGARRPHVRGARSAHAERRADGVASVPGT